MIYVTHDQVEAMTLGDKVVVMRDGKVHQTGPPEAIYTTPSDTFVATFIGSPEINLYRGRLVRKEGRPHFQGAGFSLSLDKLQIDLKEGQIEVGIRPEDIGTGQAGTVDLTAKVEMISYVGSEKVIHARLGEEALTFCAPKDAVLRPGNVVPVTINPGRLHVFHKGKRI
jgi:multiple sugar transport system ATP-binding protein